MNKAYIDELDHSNEDNYINIKIVKEKDKARVKAKCDELERKINKLKQTNDKTKKIIRIYKTKIISYILALAVVIGAPVGAYTKAKNTPREKLYKTYKEIHTTVDEDYSDLKLRHCYIYTNINDVAKYKTDYEEILPYEETIEIKEYSPWITEGTESKRKIVTLRQDAKIIGNIFYENELPDIVLGYGSHQEYEYRYNVEIPYKDKYYTEKIYEVTRLVQDTNDYIEKDLPISTYTDLIIILLIELLLLIGEVEMTQNTLIGHLIEEIIKLSNSKKISAKQKQELSNLIDEYLRINKKCSKTRKRNV